MDPNEPLDLRVKALSATNNSDSKNFEAQRREILLNNNSPDLQNVVIIGMVKSGSLESLQLVTTQLTRSSSYRLRESILHALANVNHPLKTEACHKIFIGKNEPVELRLACAEELRGTLNWKILGSFLEELSNPDSRFRVAAIRGVVRFLREKRLD